MEPNLWICQCDHNVPNRLPLVYPPTMDCQRFVFGGRDARGVESETPPIPLPKGWQACVKSAVVHVFSLAHYAIVQALHEECALLREDLRINLDSAVSTRTAQLKSPTYPNQFEC